MQSGMQSNLVNNSLLSSLLLLLNPVQARRMSSLALLFEQAHEQAIRREEREHAHVLVADCFSRHALVVRA